MGRLELIGVLSRIVWLEKDGTGLVCCHLPGPSFAKGHLCLSLLDGLLKKSEFSRHARFPGLINRAPLKGEPPPIHQTFRGSHYPPGCAGPAPRPRRLTWGQGSWHWQSQTPGWERLWAKNLSPAATICGRAFWFQGTWFLSFNRKPSGKPQLFFLGGSAQKRTQAAHLFAGLAKRDDPISAKDLNPSTYRLTR